MATTVAGRRAARAAGVPVPARPAVDRTVDTTWQLRQPDGGWLGSLAAASMLRRVHGEEAAGVLSRERAARTALGIWGRCRPSGHVEMMAVWALWLAARPDVLADVHRVGAAAAGGADVDWAAARALVRLAAESESACRAGVAALDAGEARRAAAALLSLAAAVDAAETPRRAR